MASNLDGLIRYLEDLKDYCFTTRFYENTSSISVTALAESLKEIRARLKVLEDKTMGTFDGIKRSTEMPWRSDNNGWISIKDAKPDYGRRFLGYFDSTEMAIGELTDRSTDRYCLKGEQGLEWIFFPEPESFYLLLEDSGLTHWQWLPDKPKDM